MNEAFIPPVYNQEEGNSVPARQPFAGTIGQLLAEQLPKLREELVVESDEAPTAGSVDEQQSSSLTYEEEQQVIRKELDRLHREQEQAERSLLLEQLAEYEISLAGNLPDPRPVIARNGGEIIGSEGNISAVVGEAKSRKSFLCTAIVGDLLHTSHQSTNGFRSRPTKTLWIDTEQSELHVRKLARRISTLTEWNDPETVHCLLKLYALREEPPKERMKIVRQAIKAWLPRLVVIDGVADLQHNTNDLEESEQIVTELMALSSIYKCHILCVLHTNPNSDKARGHVGSALQRKAETVLYVHRAGDRTLVEPQFCRNEPFERFAFRIDNEASELGLPVPTELPDEQSDTTPPVVAVLRDEYGGVASRPVLVKKLVERGLSENNAQVSISRALRRGLLVWESDEHLLRLSSAKAV